MPKWWECNHCGKKFPRSGKLEAHKNSCEKEVKLFKCDVCGKTFAYKRGLVYHSKVCQGPPPRQELKCHTCSKTFLETWPLERHESSCKLTPTQCTCHHCGKTFVKRCDMNRHASKCRSRPVQPPQNNLLTCRQCGHCFQGFRALRHHQLESHVGGAVVHQDPGWLADADPELQRQFRWHRNVILGPHDLSQELVHTYNFPAADNGFSPQDLVNHIRFIFESEGKSFRVNIAAGLLLQNIETGEFRYFHPHRNVWFFDKPFLIQNVRDLERLIEQLRKLDLQEQVKVDRPDTKWHVVAIVNLRYSVFLTSFALGCPDVRLPDHIIQNRFIKTLLTDTAGDRLPYNDKLCFFRALSVNREDIDVEGSTRYYCTQWMQYKGLEGEFPGVHLDDFPQLEEVFSVSINVLTLEESGEAHTLYTTTRHFQEHLNLNSWETHLSLITNIEKYSRKYICETCNTPFHRLEYFKAHVSKCKGEDSTRLVYPGGFYQSYTSLFDQIESWGIEVKEKPYNFFATYDFECYLKKVPQPDTPTNTQWLAEHVPISVSIASNVPGFEEPHCIVEPDLDVLLTEMLNYLEEIREQSSFVNSIVMSDVLRDLDLKGKEFSRLAHDNPTDAPLSVVDEYERLLEEVNTLTDSLASHIDKLCVVGFNSGKYDLNVIQKRLVEHLELDEEGGSMVIRKQNQYCCISAKSLRFLDISNYLAPHTSYDAFLRAYKCSVQKSHFPYEFFDSEEKLHYPRLPGYDSFYSSLKGINTLEAEYRAYDSLLVNGASREEALVKLRLSDTPLTGQEQYQKLQRLWKKEDMQTLQDLLIYYNNLDVAPFVEAVEKMIKVYENRGINMLRDAVSVPGISRISLFRCARELNVSFPIFGTEDHELHTLFKTNIVGGPSIIHHRYHERGKTTLRSESGPEFKEVVGFDANNLYGWALSQPLCCGAYVLRHEDDQYIPHKREKYMVSYHYLDWTAQQHNIRIDHRLNSGKEHRVSGYFLDGFNATSQTAWEFHGCYWHGHEHLWPEPGEADEKRAMLRKRRERTEARIKILRDHGLTVIEKWECEFREEMQRNPLLKAFVASRQPAFFQLTGTQPQTCELLLEGVKSGNLYGFVECDIRVPEQWEGNFRPSESPEEYFSEFPPLFCSTNIPFSCIGEHMQNYVRSSQLQKHLDAGFSRETFHFKEPLPRRLLVGGLRAERILLHTDLLSWYLDHGLKVTRIYKVLEFQSSPCFKPFIDEMTELRREADKDPDQSIIADTAKLLCNSSYGSLLMNKEKHQDVKYVHGKEQAVRYVKTSRFKSMTEFGDGLFELHLEKQTVKLDLPIYLGVQILQLAKLSLLRFYHDFLRRCCDFNKFQVLHIDTDSMYIAHGEERWEDIIRPDYREEYENQVKGCCHVLDVDPNKSFFPRSCCSDHVARDKRRPGLYKLEFTGGISYVGLASKTYWISTPSSQKFTSKGLQKKTLQKDARERYMRVLTTQKPDGATNIGFRAHHGTIFTYSQYRQGLPYFYCKREVLSDGVSTRPLKLTLNPWK